nr:(2Fe-2S)-binding protein [Paradesulfitobacterium ferrireducens]
MINGQPWKGQVEAHETLLDLIRDKLGLTGTKKGCDSGECGACTVILNGLSVNSCIVPALEVEGKEVLTIEGLSRGEVLHPIQEAFISEGAVQCGFCTPGMIMSTKALLDSNPHPSKQEIRQALAGNLCRCTGYGRIVAAVEKAAKMGGDDLAGNDSREISDKV